MNIKTWQILILLVLVAIGTLPFANAYADFSSGLVTCGNQETGPTQSGSPIPIRPCTFADFWNFLARIVRFLTEYIGVPLAVFGIGVGGLRLIIGSNSEGERTKAKEIIYASLIGLFIALAAWLIVNTIISGLGAKIENNPLQGQIQ